MYRLLEEIQKALANNKNIINLPKDELVVLKADDEGYERGLLVRLLDDGGYKVAYWYEKPDGPAPIEILVDGKSIKKDAKIVEFKFHPENYNPKTDAIAADKRIPEKDKTGKKRPKDKHSDLYTDEDPKGTITGLGFKNKKVALESIRKINRSNRTHAHKVQAMLVMVQRLKVAIKRTKDKEKLKDLRAALKVYEPAFEKLKQSKK